MVGTSERDDPGDLMALASTRPQMVREMKPMKKNARLIESDMATVMQYGVVETRTNDGENE